MTNGYFNAEFGNWLPDDEPETEMEITESAAKEFMRDLRGTVRKENCVMTLDEIKTAMRIPAAAAIRFLTAATEFGFTRNHGNRYYLMSETNPVNYNVDKVLVSNFMKHLRHKVYGNPNTEAGGIMSAELVAEHMDVSVLQAKRYLISACKYGFSERQGGGYVI